MKRTIAKYLVRAIFTLLLYTVLLRMLAGSNIVAAIFCPGPHLPAYYPVLMFLFILARLYVVLLPGIFLSRVGLAWLKQRQK